MSEKKRYIGITIGPIFNTMNLVSTPAALWASSYIFSCVGKYICEELTESYGVAPEQILSPYFNKNDALVSERNRSGIGLYHDRVVFEAGTVDVKDMAKLREKVLDRVCDRFGFSDEEDRAYLHNYIMIAAAQFCSEEPIADSGQILDSLELSCPFVVAEKSNPILEKFSGGDNVRNEGIKKIAREKLNIDLDQWQLLKDKKIVKSLEEIAAAAGENATSRKLSRYYAVVRSDGDNMSKIIGSLQKREEYNDFSHACFEYCAEISDLVRDYGGVTIYAGGDDLLALLPCENECGKTLFNFIWDANGVFEKNFRTYIEKLNQLPDKPPLPTLSMGIFISYYKYPLYEALEKSAGLLFEKAKSIKNCAAVQLQKHSGQSTYVLVKHEELDEFLELQRTVLSVSNDTEKEEKFLLSAAQKLETFQNLFALVDSDKADRGVITENLFANTFDAADQKIFSDDIKAIQKCFLAFDGEKRPEPDRMKSMRVETIISALRILKFYTEKGGDE